MLGDKIRQHRKLNHFSQEELAEKLGVSRQSISFWENNQTQPTVENIVVLAKLFHISTDELLASNNDINSECSEPVFIPTPQPVAQKPQTVAMPAAPNSPEEESIAPVTNIKESKNRRKTIAIVSVVLACLLVVGFCLSIALQ